MLELFGLCREQVQTAQNEGISALLACDLELLGVAGEHLRQLLILYGAPLVFTRLGKDSSQRRLLPRETAAVGLERGRPAAHVRDAPGSLDHVHQSRLEHRPRASSQVGVSFVALHHITFPVVRVGHLFPNGARLQIDRSRPCR